MFQPQDSIISINSRVNTTIARDLRLTACRHLGTFYHQRVPTTWTGKYGNYFNSRANIIIAHKSRLTVGKHFGRFMRTGWLNLRSAEFSSQVCKSAADFMKWISIFKIKGILTSIFSLSNHPAFGDFALYLESYFF